MFVHRFGLALAAGVIAAYALAACALLVGAPDGYHLFPSTGDVDAADVDDGNGDGNDAGETFGGDVRSIDGDGDVAVPADTAPSIGFDAGFGGPPIRLARGENDPEGIAVSTSGTTLYWSNSGDSTLRELLRNLDGSATDAGPKTLFTLADAGAPPASDVAISGGTLYALVGPAATTQTCRTFFEVPLLTPSSSACASPSNLCSSNSVATRLAVDTNDVYLSSGDSCYQLLYEAKPGTSSDSWKSGPDVSQGVVAMTSDGTTLYYAVDTAIYALSLANNTSMPFALSPSQVADIAVDLSNVYWINGGGDVMMLAKADAGSPATVLATGQLQPNRIAVDGSSVFWTNLGQTAGQGSVGMVSLGGGPARMLALSQAYPWGIAVDVFGVYWTTFGDGSVWMMAR